jgi:hypothetical protein
VTALEEAERKAFESLCQQLQLGDPGSFNLSPEQISRMVTGYELVQEDMSATSYRAVLHVSFSPAQVRAVTGKTPQPVAPPPEAVAEAKEKAAQAEEPTSYEEVIAATKKAEPQTQEWTKPEPVVDNPTKPAPRYDANDLLSHAAKDPAAQLPQEATSPAVAAVAPPQTPHIPALHEAKVSRVLVVPVLHRSGQSLLWGEGNLWLKTWQKAALGQAQPALLLPQGDMQDASLFSPDIHGRPNLTMLQRLAARYQADEILVLNATLLELPAARRLSVRAEPAGLAPSGSVPSFSFALASNEDAPALMAQGVSEALSRLGRPLMPVVSASPSVDAAPAAAAAPVAAAPVAAAQAGRVKLVVPLRHMAEWVQIRRALEEDAPRVGSLEVIAVAPSQVDVWAEAPAGQTALADALRTLGYQPEMRGDYWIVRR